MPSTARQPLLITPLSLCPCLLLSPSPLSSQVIPNIPLEACLRRWMAEELLEGYFSAALGRNTVATKTQRISSFPPYLVVRMDRYYGEFVTWECRASWFAWTATTVIVPNTVGVHSRPTLHSPVRVRVGKKEERPPRASSDCHAQSTTNSPRRSSSAK